jgi:hypothetical protein
MRNPTAFTSAVIAEILNWVFCRIRISTRSLLSRNTLVRLFTWTSRTLTSYTKSKSKALLILTFTLTASHSKKVCVFLCCSFCAFTYVVRLLLSPVNGKLIMAVVNHRRDGEWIELFRLDRSEGKDVLTHLRSIQDKTFVNLNDVALDGENRFGAFLITKSDI